ncbi:hypothetical protein ES703_38799 [subsurface metagenome]
MGGRSLNLAHPQRPILSRSRQYVLISYIRGLIHYIVACLSDRKPEIGPWSIALKMGGLAHERGVVVKPINGG